MIASTIAAGSMPGPLSEVAKNGSQPKVSCSQSAHRPDQRDDDEDAPEAVDHAGDGRQHLDDGAEDGASRAGRKSWVRKIATVMPKKPPMSSASSEL